MSDGLYRLTYFSRNLIEGDDELTRAVADIVAASERNNRAARVTGAFLVNKGCFGQILEGALPAVEATFERIQQDERHGDVHLIELCPVDERAFGSWSMTLAAPLSSTAELLERSGLSSSFDPSRVSAGTMLDTLARLVKTRWAEPAVA